MYEQLPSRDADVTRRMQEARRRAVANRIDRFERSKVNTDAALEELSVVLARTLDWPSEAAAYSARLEAGVQWGSARVTADLDASLAIHRPRAAQQLLARRSRYLQSSEFTKLRTDLNARIHAEAVNRCSALETELTPPFRKPLAAFTAMATTRPYLRRTYSAPRSAATSSTSRGPGANDDHMRDTDLERHHARHDHRAT
jgi:hypothetical protein